MVRKTLSNDFYEASLAQETSVVTAHLLTVFMKLDNGEEITERYVDQFIPVECQGEVYQPAVFKITLGNDLADGVPNISLDFDSGDRQFIRRLNDNRESPKIELRVVLIDGDGTSAVQDHVEVGPIQFEMKSFTVQATSVSADLGIEPILSEPVPFRRYTPTLAPGLYDIPTPTRS